MTKKRRKGDLRELKSYNLVPRVKSPGDEVENPKQFHGGACPRPFPRSLRIRRSWGKPSVFILDPGKDPRVEDWLWCGLQDLVSPRVRLRSSLFPWTTFKTAKLPTSVDFNLPHPGLWTGFFFSPSSNDSVFQKIHDVLLKITYLCMLLS